MTLEQYIDNIDKRYRLGNATEHTFRGDLQQLIESLVPGIRATNEPKRQSCGAPDYILTLKEIPIGFIEAKDVGDSDLDGTKKAGNKEQFDRYKSSLNNLIFTDYINFHLYRNGEFVSKIAIGQIFPSTGGVPASGGRGGGITPIPENFAAFTNLIKDFCSHIGQTIKSSKKLAEMMAGKARLLSDIIGNALTSDEEKHEDSTLKDQMLAFKQILIHDITPKGFADVYAQTIAYGMFAARYHDPTLPTFSRQEAAELIPKSNPFLRKLFQYIAGFDLDDRIKWVVDDLVQIFLACNVEEMLRNYGKSTKMEDPIIHFYEDFLSEYDPKLRKARGVWYTPQPVVNFIVRAVDDILKTEFDLPQGLADTSKTKITLPSFGHPPKGREVEVHKVQILDPATGTGTFLAEVVKHIYKKFEGQQGIWSNYVETHLLPRLNGFELLMASYAMAHLKLDLLLTETGYASTPSGGVPASSGRGGSNQRLRIYLTNSLEESHPDTGTLFANWLSTEANEANHIKRNTPVMCIIGNPPYAVSSTNKNDWIENLIADYKKNLNEKSYNSLSDDYVKFIRYGQHFIEKNGSGVLAYISNNSFIDGIVFRQMRKHLLECFDKIYILDLHGNSKKNEVCPDGSPDQNVFDIMQGVSINIFVKTGKKKHKDLGKVFHFDLYGKRESKYEYLKNNSLKSLKWNALNYSEPNYYFVEKDFGEIDEYEKWININELFNFSASGMVGGRDSLVINFKNDFSKITKDFRELEINELRSLYNLKESRDWTLENAILDVKNNLGRVIKTAYKAFDKRYTYFTGKSKGFVQYPRKELVQHFLKENFGLALMRNIIPNDRFSQVFITNSIIDKNYYSFQTYLFPLYVYPETTAQQTLGQTSTGSVPERTPNLNSEIVNQIADKLGLAFTPEKFPSTGGVLASGGRGGNNSTNGVPADRGGNNSTSGVVLTTIHNTPIYRNFVENLPHNPSLNQLAKDKRKSGILSEVLFWQQVHKEKFHKIDFDRQRIIGNYIVDFYVKTLGLVIEIDGSSHDNKQDYDAARQAYFESLGLKVFRCSDLDVKKNMQSVLVSLEDFIVREYGEKTTPPAQGGHPSEGGEFAPIDILDYIYAVLHSPSYREKYKEFLKIDFPRVPYPKDQATFWKLVKLGGEIRQIHLLESPKVEQYITQYPVNGDNVVMKPRFQNSPPLEGCPQDGVVGKVYINDTQYFDNVPLVAWEFYIGGYQPAQKWLKDRKDRTLEFEDILHYQKIIVALSETDRIMKEIDKVGVE